MLRSSRLVFSLAVLVACIASTLLFRLQPREPRPWVRLVPADVLAVASLDGSLDSIPLLAREILERLSSEAIAGDPGVGWAGAGAFLDRLTALGVMDLKEIGIVVHSLEKRQSGAYKVHFSVILTPASAGPTLLGEQIGVALGDLLGFRAEPPLGAVRVFQGSEPHHLLYLSAIDRFAVISNGLGRDLEMRRARDGLTPNLRDRRSFQEIWRNLPRKRGAFVYWDGGQLLPFLPELGWVFWLEGRELRDTLWVVEP